MKSATGIDVKLLVAGVALQEHPDPEDGGTKYVEAVAGSLFTIEFVAPQGIAPLPTDSVNCRVYLDGKYATDRVFDATLFAHKPYSCALEGVDAMTSRGRELERFIFAQLETTDDPLVAGTKPEQFKDLGIVKIVCHWCRKSSQLHTVIANSFKPVGGDASISEKLLKGRAISTQASVAKPEPVAGVFNTVKVTYPYGAEPFASFQFKYRSRKDLQVEGIIEKSPEPVALEDRDPASLSAEEVGQLQRNLQAKKEDMIRIKQEKREWAFDADGDDEDDEAVIVNAGAPKKQRIDLIDLTED